MGVRSRPADSHSPSISVYLTGFLSDVFAPHPSSLASLTVHAEICLPIGAVDLPAARAGHLPQVALLFRVGPQIGPEGP